MKLKEISRTATFAWSPGQQIPIIAAGTVAGAFDASFSVTSELELFRLDNINKSAGAELQPAGVVTSKARFDRLAWGGLSDKQYGLIAGGMETGELDLWDPAVILEGGDTTEALVLRNTTHSGNVRGLQFNPFQPNLLASGATNGEVFIWDVTAPASPLTPGARSTKLEDITHLAWNNKVQHILATSSTTGYTVVWDLKNKREAMHLSHAGLSNQMGGSYGMGGMSAGGTMGAGGRRGITAIAWNPDAATQIIAASEDDGNPVIVMWDLRNARAPEKASILSLSWCLKDADLLLSCGKDNRTLCWNPKNAEVIGELPPCSNWVFDVQWCPGNPDLLATASFDGKINIHSLRSSQEQKEVPASQSSDPFASIGQYTPSLVLKQPPKWLRCPVGAKFGFGGKLVRFNSKNTDSYKVIVSTVVTEPELFQRSDELEGSVDSQALNSLCEKREKCASNEFASDNWKILRTLFNEKPRAELVRHLGFTKDDVVTQISAAIKSMNLESTKSILEPTKTNLESTKSNFGSTASNLESTTSDPQSAVAERPATTSDLFGDSENIADAFAVDSTYSTSEDIFSVVSTATETTMPPTNLGPFKIYPSDESDIDKLITRSIVLGDFESAVNLCLQADRLSDALLLAVCGGSELVQRTQKAYFERQIKNVPYVRLLQSIVAGDLSDVVYNADLNEWQEVVVVLCTFARGEEFGTLCNALGTRLEQEYHKSVSASSDNARQVALQYRKNALLCYLAAGNLERAVNIWIAEQEEEEQEELKRAQKEGQKKSTSRFSFHAKSLQNLVEKVTVFRKAIDYVDSDIVQSLDSSNEGPVGHFKLASLYNKYTEYAELMANQGRLTVALKYLSLIPVEYRVNPNQLDILAVIRERVYNSGIDVGGLKAPVFPFKQVYVGTESEVNQANATADATQYSTQYNPQSYDPSGQSAQNYYNQYAYQQQAVPPPVVPQVPPVPAANVGLPTQAAVQPAVPLQQPYGYNQYAAPYQQTAQNSYAYQQSAYPGYNQAYTGNNQFIPPPPAATATTETSVAPPAEISAAYKKNLPNWNDPPMIPPTNPAKRTAAQLGKQSPLTSPFPASSAPVPPAHPAQAHPLPNVMGQAAPPNAGTRASPQPQTRIYGQGRSTPTPPPHANPTYRPGVYGTPAEGGYGSVAQTGAYGTTKPLVGQVPPQAPPQALPQAPPQAPPQVAHQGPPPPAPTRTPPVQLARTPTPVKTPTPANKYSPGDRTHIPAAHKPIFTILSGEMQRARQHSPPQNKKMLDDTEKRLNALFDELNNEMISESVIESLLLFSQALRVRDYQAAVDIQVKLMTTKFSECDKWIVGLKRLIDITKNIP